MRAASAADSEIGLLVSVYQNLGESESQAELKKLVTRRGVRISVFFAMGDYQSARFGGILESSVVVCIAATAILNAVFVVVIMNHFMEQCGGYFLNGSGQGSCTNVDFMGSTNLGNPGVFSQREVSVSLGGGLDGDGRS